MEATQTEVPTKSGTLKFPVIEIFGPTIQGEGLMIGVPTMFIRFGGCDFRCTMCDSMHAVDGEEIRKRADYMTAEEIQQALGPSWVTGCKWVTLSGGNPALWDLDTLVSHLHEHSQYRVATETQGTYFKHWLNEVDHLCVSPKGPGMGERFDADEFYQFMCRIQRKREKAGKYMLTLKVVVFDKPDIDFACYVHSMYVDIPMTLSIGNPHVHRSDPVRWPKAVDHLRTELLSRFVNIAGMVQKHPISQRSNVRVLPQLHVLAWGTGEGV